MNLQAKVAVVIPCYNHQEFILETLASVEKQTFQDWECVIVNDGSTDHSEEVIKNWIFNKPKFKYIFQINKGLSAARNAGIAASNAAFILPLDSDDLISDNYIENCYQSISNHPEVKLVYGKAFTFGVKLKKWNLPDYCFEDLLYKNMIYCTAMFRKADWETIGGYDETMREGLEDWEFWIHLLKNGGHVVRDSDCFFYYRIKSNSMVVKDVIQNHYGYHTRMYIFNKHLEVYCKTNFYDLYFENYQLKRIAKYPWRYNSLGKLLKIVFYKMKEQSITFFNQVFKKLKIK